MFSRKFLIFLGLFPLCILGCSRVNNGSKVASFIQEIEERVGANVFQKLHLNKAETLRVGDSESIWIQFSATDKQQREFLNEFPNGIDFVSLDMIGQFPAGKNPSWWKPEILSNAGIGSYSATAEKPSSMSLYIIVNQAPSHETWIYVYALLAE